MSSLSSLSPFKIFFDVHSPSSAKPHIEAGLHFKFLFECSLDSVKLAAEHSTQLESELLHLAMTVSASLDRFYSSCHTAEVSTEWQMFHAPVSTHDSKEKSHMQHYA